jgi:hypothetical protein
VVSNGCIIQQAGFGDHVSSHSWERRVMFIGWNTFVLAGCTLIPESSTLFFVFHHRHADARRRTSKHDTTLSLLRERRSFY